MQLSELSLLFLLALICFNPSNIAIYAPMLIILLGAIQYKVYKDITE